ncbi:MAG: hypothetical protein KAS75_05795 [Planctomycetes bacterium]|nr:hypothetical protein [Planctomycetota bacterium]
MAEEKIKEGSTPANNSINSEKEERLESFFCNTGAFGGGIIGALIGSMIYKFGKRLGKIKRFKRIAAVLTKEIHLSKKLHVNCPECGRPLKGATREMIGDTGVCPKCRAEFIIEQSQ